MPTSTSDRLIGLMVDQGPDVLVGMLGILSAGRGFVPLDPRSPDARLAHVLDDCAVRVLVTDERHQARARRLIGQAATLAHIVVLDAQGRLVDDGVAPTEDASTETPSTKGTPTKGTSAVVASPVGTSPHPDSLAYVIFTSGSTGEPKGVGITHRNLAPMLAWAQDYFSLGPHTRALQSLSYWFDFGVFEQLTTALAGGTLCIAPEDERTDPERFAARAAAWQTDTVHCTPSFARELAASGEDLSAVRILHLGGEALDTAQVDRLHAAMDPDCRLYNGYGPTEATINSTIFDLGSRREPHHREHATMPIGRPSANHRVFILDRHGRPVPPGVPGELYVGGLLVARGYLGRPALTAERFVPDPFANDDATQPASSGGRLYRTGDLVRYLPDGNIAFLGRVDHQVKLRGFRIELGEIEATLRRHPAIQDVVARVREAQPGDHRLIAWFEPAAEITDEIALDTESLRAHLRESLPDYMVPAAFVTVDAWPTTRSGKVDLRALPDPDWAAKTAGRAPATPLESQLADLFADVLGQDQVGAEDDFFALGGHSLLATRVIARIRRDLGVDLPLLQLFEAPTVAATAAEIEGIWARGDGDDEAPIMALPREHDGVTTLPLSPAQERLWILDRFEPGTDAFNMPLPLGLNGTLDQRALRRALDEVVRRHESLRTTFTSVAGVPHQVLHRPAPVDLPVIDLGDCPEAIREATLAQLIAKESRRSFDLEAGPLFRASLVRLAEDRHALLLNLHHVIADGWSIGILSRELGALYAAFQRGEPSPLTPLPIQYADYAVWQRERLTGPIAENQIAYWRNQLGARPATFELPLDRARPPVQTYRGARTTRVLEPTLHDALEQTSRARGASLFMTLLAGFKLVLSRWSGHNDIVLGTPIAGRNRAATDDLIGIFLNTLVLRTNLDDDPTFSELIDRVRETALGAFAHQDLPFERLLDVLRPDRDLARTPLFQIFFNMLNLPVETIELGDLTLEPLVSPESPSKFDLTLYAGPLPDGGFQLNAVYNADLFDADRIDALVDQYVAVLDQVVADPGRHLSAFRLGDAITGPDPSLPLAAVAREPVHVTIATRARDQSTQPALTDPHGAWSYDELTRARSRIATWLDQQGLAIGQPVAIFARRGATLPIAMLGVLDVGAAFVILDPGYPESRLAEITALADPGAVLLLGADDTSSGLPTLLATAIGDRPTLRLPPTPATLFDATTTLPAETHEPVTTTTGDDLAYVAFTSGSTGRPKGIRGRHAPLAHYANWLVDRFDLGPDDRFAMLSGLAHDPLLRDVFPALACGATLCIPDPARLLEPGYLAGWLHEERITVVNLTPAMGRLVTVADAEPLTDLRVALFVGEALRRRDTDRLRALAPTATLVNLYGATETQQALSHHVLAETDAGGPDVLPLGRGIDGVQLLILDPQGQPAAVGEVGEIHLRSPYLAAGYWAGAEDPSDRDRFQPNPFADHGDPGDRLFRTGDLGRYGSDGSVTFAGRQDNQLKIRGFRVEPAEVAARLEARDDVQHAAVVPRQSATGHVQLVAFAVAAAGTEPTSMVLRAALRTALPSYMVPAAVVLLDALPVTPNGKLDRAELGQRAQKLDRGQEIDVAYSAPKNELERIIADLLKGVLAVERVGAEDNFFELGGNSLLLVEFHQKLQAATEHTLQPVDIFNHPTARSLATFLTEKATPAPKPKTDDRAEKLKVGRARLQQRRRSRSGRA